MLKGSTAERMQQCKLATLLQPNINTHRHNYETHYNGQRHRLQHIMTCAPDPLSSRCGVGLLCRAPQLRQDVRLQHALFKRRRIVLDGKAPAVHQVLRASTQLLIST